MDFAAIRGIRFFCAACTLRPDRECRALPRIADRGSRIAARHTGDRQSQLPAGGPSHETTGWNDYEFLFVMIDEPANDALANNNR
jgi:hypothetical protein